MIAKKLIATLAVSATLALALSGCSAASGENNDGTTTLNVVGYVGGSAEPANIPEINAAFEAANPDIKVKYKYVQNTAYDQYMNTRLASGSAPDVVMTDPNRIRQWGKEGYLADLSDTPLASTMLDSVTPFAQVEGKTLGVILQNVPIGLYANMDILSKAGIDEVPQDWPSFLESLDKLKAAGQPGLLLANQTGWTSEQLMFALSASLIPADWAPNYDDGDSKFNPTWKPILERIQELLTDGYVDGKTMNGVEPFSDGNSLFAQGKYAYTIMGAWQLQSFAKDADFDFTLNPVPGGDAGTEPASFTFVGLGLSVSSASKQQEAAQKYVEFFTEAEQYTGFMKAETSFTTLKGVDSLPLEHADSFVEAFNDGRTVPSPVEYMKAPDPETTTKNVGSQLFDDPTQSLTSLLDQMDAGIAKTP